jgi:hypothetical protein
MVIYYRKAKIDYPYENTFRKGDILSIEPITNTLKNGVSEASYKMKVVLKKHGNGYRYNKKSDDLYSCSSFSIYSPTYFKNPTRKEMKRILMEKL